MHPSTSTSQQQSITAIRLPAVLAKTGLSRTHVYRLIQQGRFPKPAHPTERLSIWNEAEVNAWLADKFAGEQQ